MNTKLPKVFTKPIDREINVNQKSSVVGSTSIKLDDILNDTNKYLFKHQYLITLKNGKTINSSIISKKDAKIITIDNDLIDIDDIKSIVETKK